MHCNTHKTHTDLQLVSVPHPAGHRQNTKEKNREHEKQKMTEETYMILLICA